MREDDANEVKELTQRVSDALNAEIIVFGGPILEGCPPLIDWANNKIDGKPNSILVLSTFGGSPNGAYRIARALQRRAARHNGFFLVFIPWMCKSAGTLLSIGADAIMMTDEGELGPLDVQLLKKDELNERTSGLTPAVSFTMLEERAFKHFETFFLGILDRGGSQISTRLAAKIATELTGELLGNIYGQIDPLAAGETHRSMLLGSSYAERLNSHSGNLRPGALDRLVTGYSDHGFVIDREEAQELFNQHIDPSPELFRLAQILLADMAKGTTAPTPHIRFLTEELNTSEKEDEAVNENDGAPHEDIEDRQGGDVHPPEDFAPDGDDEEIGEGDGEQ